MGITRISLLCQKTGNTRPLKSTHSEELLMSRMPTYRPVVEALEQRELLAGIQAYVAIGNLYVLGTPGNDFINVAQTNNQISVAGTQIAVRNSRVNSIDASSISKVIVYGYGGDDFIDLATIKNDATIYAGAGKDMIRCGVANVTVYDGGGFDRIFHAYPANAPFLHGEAVADIHQGHAPVCQTLAALAEAIQQGHNFANDIRYLGNYLYEVKLVGNLPTQKVYFDGWTTSYDPVVSGGEFWTVLMQRARLQALGLDPAREYTQVEWDSWNQKTAGRLYSVGEALYDYTGSVSAYHAIDDASPLALQASLARGDYVVAQSRSVGGISSDGVVGNHAYALLATYFEAGVWKVRLYNPWGTNGGAIDALDPSHPVANDGVITLSWQQFTNSNNFKGYFVAVKK
jgi:Ca2+-binding RTX toxin-like protein